MADYLEVLTNEELNAGGAVGKSRKQHWEDNATELRMRRTGRSVYLGRKLKEVKIEPPEEWWVKRERNKKIAQIRKNWKRVEKDPNGYEYTQDQKGIKTATMFYPFAPPKPQVVVGLNSKETRHARRSLMMQLGTLQRHVPVGGELVAVDGPPRAGKSWSKQSPEVDIKIREGEHRKPFIPKPSVKPLYIPPVLSPAKQKRAEGVEKEYDKQLRKMLRKKKGGLAKEALLLSGDAKPTKVAKSFPKTEHSKNKLTLKQRIHGENKVSDVSAQVARRRL